VCLILILYYCGRSWAGGPQKKRRASCNSHIDVFNIKKYGEEEEEIEIKLHTIAVAPAYAHRNTYPAV
jgi:hypothetical protein